MITWPNGQRSEVFYNKKSDIFLIMSGKLYKGTLNNGLISWDNGDIWTTIPGIDRLKFILKFYYKISALTF